MTVLVLVCQTTNNRHNATFLCFNLSMFTEEDGTSINDEGRKGFQLRKNAKIFPIF